MSDTASPTAPLGSTTPTTFATTAATLRRLYVVRFVFAIVWALVILSMASRLGPVTVVLLVLYPLFDVGAAIVDARASRASGSVTGQRLTMVISMLTAVGVAIACASGIPAVLRVWGAWAIVAGLLQLIVAVRRRRLGGQWALIVSGAISILAGGSFIATAGAADPTLTNAAGYAIPGGVFFLISALRLNRTAKGN
jgi:uncharacterized membrane protein HdeD (DUF308 family)